MFILRQNSVLKAPFDTGTAGPIDAGFEASVWEFRIELFLLRQGRSGVPATADGFTLSPIVWAFRLKTRLRKR
jgi:hypothetical protein